MMYVKAVHIPVYLFIGAVPFGKPYLFNAFFAYIGQYKTRCLLRHNQ